MRSLIVAFAFAGVTFGQALTEYGAAAAGGAAGGAAGKKVSDGITSIFGKVDAQTKDAAKDAKGKPSAKPAPAASATPATSPGPAISAGPGPSAGPSPAPPPSAAAPKKPRPARTTVAKAVEKPDLETYPDPPVDHTVPPPPAPAIRRPAVVAKPEPAPQPVAAPVALPPPPPPPQMTEDNLRTVAVGTRREELLKLGAPFSRITMIDSGHLLEIYHYASREASLGIVRLNDGAVASVELR